MALARGILLTALAGLLGRAALQEAGPPVSPVGTYRIAVCPPGPCAPDDSLHAFAFGYLVLSDAALETATLPDSARLGLQWFSFDGVPNGCFILARGGAPHSNQRGSFAGAGEVGATRWDTAGTGALHFSLYRSPDAGHGVSAIVTPDGLRGRGKSWGAGVVEVAWPPDTVVALRVGPPDFARCVDASVAYRRKLLHRAAGV